MVRIKHRCRDHKTDPATEILIIGTFNPYTKDNPADFFYGRPKNHLWTLLPSAYNEADMKKSTKDEKLKFLKKHNLDFADLISEICVPENTETDYRDSFIDAKVTVWNDVISKIEQFMHLKKVCFTRKTFSDIPNIRKKIEDIQLHCERKGIHFQYLITPARVYSKDKQDKWTEFIKF